MALGNGHSAEDDKIGEYIIWAAIILLSIGLSITAGYGAWVSTNMWWFVMVIVGLDLIALMALSRAVVAKTWLRRIGALIIFFAAIWACIENAKEGLIIGYAQYFEKTDTGVVLTAEELRNRAELRIQDADLIKENRPLLAAQQADQLAGLRRRIAQIESNIELMQAQSKQGIERAQTFLASQNKYLGEIDGIRAGLTEAAMRDYGDSALRELDLLRSEEANLTGQTVVVEDETKLREEAISLEAQAVRQESRVNRIYQILLAAELGRALGYWAMLLTATGALGAKKHEDDTETPRTEEEETQPEDTLDEGAGDTGEPDSTEDGDPSEEPPVTANEDQDLGDLFETETKRTRAEASRENLEKARRAQQFYKENSDAIPVASETWDLFEGDKA